MARGKWVGVVSDFIIVSLVAILLGLVLLGWLEGCGEHYVDSDGNVHPYECSSIFVWRKDGLR